MLELQARKLALTRSVLGHDSDGALKFDGTDLAALLAPLSTPAGVSIAYDALKYLNPT